MDKTYVYCSAVRIKSTFDNHSVLRKQLCLFLITVPDFIGLLFILLGNKLIAVAARGGVETLKPALQRVYMTRASAYRDALKSFIQGYQEGIHQVMEKNKKEEDSKSQHERTSAKS